MNPNTEINLKQLRRQLLVTQLLKYELCCCRKPLSIETEMNHLKKSMRFL